MEPKTILLVEDEAIIAMAQSIVIRKFGYNVVIAHSGLQAVKAVEENPSIKLILMDIDLGEGIDGTEAAQRILALRQLPILFLTSHAEEEYVERVKKITRYGYVIKNSGEFVLHSAIEMAFELYTLYSQARENEFRFRQIYENVKVGIAQISLDFKVMAANEKYCAMLGYSEAELIGHHLRDFTHPETLKENFEKQQALANGEIEHYHMEKKFIHKDGYTIVGLLDANLIRDISGHPSYFLGSVVDISEQKESRLKLQKQNEELFAAFEELALHDQEIKTLENERFRTANTLKALIQSSPNLIAIFDSQGFYHYISESMAVLYGKKLEEIEGRSIHEFMPLSIIDDHLKIVEILKENPTPYHKMDLLTMETGTKFIESTLFPVSGGNEQPELFGLIGIDVTRQVQATQALEDEKRHMDSILSSLDTGLSLIRQDLSVAWVNSKIRDMFPDDDPIGTKCYRFYENRSEPCPNCGTIQAFKTRLKHETDRYNEQTKSWYHVVSMPIFNPNGTIEHVLESITDITKRKKMEQELEMERRRLAYVLEGTHVGSWEWNVQTGETRFNERWAEIIGYSLQELEPLSVQTWLAHCHPEDLKCSEVALQKHFLGESERYEYEVRMRHRDGHWVWVLDRGKVMEWSENGQPLLMAGTHQDISERKKMEAELDKQQRFFRSILDTTQDGFWIVNMEGRFIDVNEAYLTMSGYTREEFLNMKIPDVNFQEKPEETTERMRRMRENGYEKFEVRHRRKDGTVFDVEISGNYISQPESCFICFCRDVSDRNQTERMLAQNVREKEAMLHEFQHRVKNSFNMIIALHYLKQSATLSGESTQILKDLTARIQSIADLYTLLNQSNQYQEINLNSYFRMIIDSILQLRDNIVCEHTLEAIIVSTHFAATLGMILTELLTNALKYAFPDGKRGKIAVVLERNSSERIDLRIEDDGMGLPEGFKLETSAGMGLELVQSMVNQLRGKLTVSSETGVHYRIEIPIS